METRRTADPSRFLAGYHVLVTRPATRADALCDKLAVLGARVHAAPLLAIDLLPETPELRAAAQDLDRFDIVIVTSLNAVAAALPLLSSFWPQWPAEQHWLAVGAGTAAALAGYGVDAAVPDEATSEGLLALAVLASVAGRRVLLLSGEGGRDLLEKNLMSRGAQVTRIATYRRVATTAGSANIDAFRDVTAAQGKRVVLVTSAEALQNLLALAPWLPASDVQLVVASARIADEARHAGVHRVAVAGGAGNEKQLAALLRHAGVCTDEDCA